MVKVQQKVRVTVLSVDRERKRIALSMKNEPGRKTEGEPPREGKSAAGKPPTRREKKESGPFNDAFVRAFRRAK